MYDAIVIGAGPGGYVCAVKLAQLGRKVLVVEKGELGGTCTNLGCIPTKALLSGAELYWSAKEKGSKLGVEANPSLNLRALKDHMNKVVMMSRKGIEYLFKKNGVELKKGTAYFLEPWKIEIEETGEVFEARNIVLANGSVPRLFSPFDKVEGIWTSDDVFSMESLPSSILIVGAGAIGVEFATLFSLLGVEVTLVEILEHILPLEDGDIAFEVKKSLQKRAVKVYESSKVVSLTKDHSGVFSWRLETPSGLVDGKSDKVLVSIGRTPRVSDDLKEVGLEAERGVKVDSRMKTNLPNVYAVGDITGGFMLAHVAMMQGVIAAYNIANIGREMDYSAIPSVIFSYPEVASVGMRERDLSDKKYRVFKYPFSANGRARTIEEKEGFVKVIVDEKGIVVGFSVVGPMATELIMEGIIATRFRLKAEDLSLTVHPHPTLSEAILGAFEGAVDKPIHL
ncbi:MAG: dihydrolipoyl dehydrogenase [Synergistetes bacterium]|nr:dihydrolipoyl dehydrogenase [Synergistota bacterium]MCX8127278.1 dihydrolipoyl dehydrogenase [Synergistota bacterium]MDW8191836.1 dihydrolipoyl dehydrogenase [Synergistota bacterium]